MSYLFNNTSVDSLHRYRQRRRELRARAAAGMASIRPGRPTELFARRPRMRGRSERPAELKTVPPPPSAAVIALTRLGLGLRPGEVAAFEALGATDPERLQAWLEIQLDPASIDDSAAETRIAQSGFTTLDKTLEQLWADHVVPAGTLPWEEVMRPFYETVLVTFLRGIHSERRLLETMAGFWHDHFNVYADDFPHGPVWPHTDRDVIRVHALGNFRQMLEGIAKTPAMLFYLDNFLNSEEDANENYARELLELHGLGADSYLGSIPQSQVPMQGGWPIGWVEEDVVAAARCLTGWTVDLEWWGSNTGAFLYLESWHDVGPKHVLGADLPPGRQIEDGLDLLDLVAQHPATGRHIAGKLCRRLLGDEPPAAVIDAAAALFTAQHAAPDQIAQVVRAIVLAPEFLDTWGDKVKRPFEIAVSAFRGAQGDLPFTLGDDITSWFYWEYYQTGQPLFSWGPPNGYPDFKAAWNSTSPRVKCWRLANMLIQVADDNDDFYFDIFGQTPPETRSAHDLVGFWGQRILGRPLADGEFDELVDFMAQGHNPHFDLPLDDDMDTRDRLRALIALIFMTPSFLWR